MIAAQDMYGVRAGFESFSELKQAVYSNASEGRSLGTILASMDREQVSEAQQR